VTLGLRSKEYHQEAVFRVKDEAIHSMALNSALSAQACAMLFGGIASMTIVLVHGNPETKAIWDDLVPQLRGDDVVRLSPPGFGSAIPSDFDCATDAYRDWLAGELTKSPQPIDLVGHDWGGGHVMRIAMERPGLIRSWTKRYFGMFDAERSLTAAIIAGQVSVGKLSSGR
jgi:pimeloyl-ACP methyl ester carboxylesterase